MTTYPYAQGDLIGSPNTYFYSQYGGRDFLASWAQSRKNIFAKLPAAQSPSPALQVDHTSRRSADLLERALFGDAELREAFVKKFEIHKRVHDAYDDGFRAIDKTARRTLSLYLRAADLFAAAYGTSGELRHLNVYLKCLDTLCALAETLPADLAARLAWHLDNEQNCITEIMAEQGLEP